MGCISPLGNDVPSTWAAALAGQSGAAPITLFDASEHETRFAAEVKGYDAGEKFGRKEARRMDRYTQFAMGATAEAMAHAGLTVTEGKYHQVKRMVAAAGNRVEALHREAVGDFVLPTDLKPGEWRWLAAVDLQKMGYSA